MEGQFLAMIMFTALTLQFTEAGGAVGHRQADCIELAKNIHDYVVLMDQRNPYANISDEIKWTSSVDVNNETSLRRILCGIEGRPLPLVSKYLIESGIVQHMVARMYGSGVVMHGYFKQELETVVTRAPAGSLMSRLARLGVMILNAFEDRGFFCFDSPAVAAVRERFTGASYLQPMSVSCQVFDEIAQDVQAFVADYSIYYLSYIVEMTGANLSDAESNGRFLCDLSQQDSFEGIVNVFSDYGVVENEIVYGLRMLPESLGPITTYEEIARLTDMELLERYPYLTDPDSEGIDSFRYRHRLAVNLHRNLKKLADSITSAQS